MDQLNQIWLYTLCKLLKGVTHAVVFSYTSEKDSYTPSAFWPENLDDYQEFASSAKIALSKGECIVLHHKNTEKFTGEPLDIIACPMSFDEHFYGVIVFQLTNRIPANLQAAMRQVEAASLWLAVMVRQHSSTEKSQLVTLIELVASCLEHEHFKAAATEVVTDLTARLACDRISIGFFNDNRVTVEAVSHSAGYDRKSSLIRDIGEAMLEAMDQNCTILFPESTDAVFITLCHSVLVRDHKIGTVLTVPYAVNGKLSGAVLAERPHDRPFEVATIEHFKHIVSLIGPVLDIRYREEQWLPLKIHASIRRFVVKIIGSGHFALKLSITTAIFVLAFLSFAYGNYHITSSASLEARTQRVIVALQDGYIADANVRPGDIIQGGDTLGSLDDKDLKLERQKWSGQLEQLERENRDALAKHNRSEVGINDAKILQAEAQLNLVKEQLARTRFTAPFDGFIVSGDLTQAIGSPVKRGQILFTVAPLVAYRVILRVDERDINNVKEGQHGELVLSSMPSKLLSFTVEKITPVSTTEEGKNFFRVEGGIKKNSDLLRPGMEGVAKINIDRRILIWIWTHKLVDWLRLTLWSIRPF
jgi:RND family efflux transporter MFP subunit